MSWVWLLVDGSVVTFSIRLISFLDLVAVGLIAAQVKPDDSSARLFELSPSLVIEVVFLSLRDVL